MKVINVVKEQCIGCGACVATDPEHFNFDDDGKSNVITNENLESGELVNAIESCPTSAIDIIDKDNNEDDDANENLESDEEHNCEHCEHKCDHAE